MRKFLIIIALEAYAVLLAFYQSLGSVRTDEAKYLLNIPYPHPPLGRSILSWLELVPNQELVWRIVFATLLVQAVWFVAKMANRLLPEDRMTLCGLWIFAASILFQSGTLMMAVLTALQGLVFVWLLLEVKSGKWKVENYSGWIALFWLISIFTAYQAVLYLPIVIAIFVRMRINPFLKIFAISIPLLLAVLYISINPLVAASFVNAGSQHEGMPIADLLKVTITSWLWAGSAILSVCGLIGILRGKQWALLLSFLLVVAFHITSFRQYYPIFFLPLLVGGVAAYPNVLRRSATLLALQIIMATYIFTQTSLIHTESPARMVMREINNLPQEGVILITGSFGHQWQYESRSPIFRYRPSLLSKAKAVVCLDSCPGVSDYGFYQIGNIPQEVWVRKY